MATAASTALFSLQGQTALVTGGTRGIGQAICIALAEAGADLILIQRNRNNIETQRAVEALGRKATIYTADLASKEEVAAITSTVLKDGHSIHILINCAGIQRRHPCHEFPDNDWNEVIQVNLNTVFTLCRDVGAHMLNLEPSSVTGRRGSIINFASLLTFQGGLTVPAYSASKGYIETEMNTALLNNSQRLRSISERIPAGRWGVPEDFKASVVFLASKGSAYISGHILTIDGGWMGR
ncbi:hypothetical protein DID88_004281 [Monilinia fructigena]|uniref:Ketoreductase domain-containing protein n=1 Tax=Monilinia fructigena TaxID=38457 RepID=A0A395ISE6_9HELO|nr:hypothetical protein DID88_004281 [Monilinia fructigena]